MMDQVNFSVVLLLLVQCILIAGIFLSLFRLSKIFGKGLLFAAIGVCQFMQVFLFNTLSYEVYPGFLISPGSIVLFSANLFLALAVYIRDDAETVRTLIYTLIVSDFLLALLRYVLAFNLGSPEIVNHYQLPAAFFAVNPRIVLVGTSVLFLDGILLILIYEFISKRVLNLFIRILFTMSIVLMTDAILFSIGAFAGQQGFWDRLIPLVLGKEFAAIVFSALFALILPYIRKQENSFASNDNIHDIFSWLTYRQKFEQISIEKKQQQQKLQESEQRFLTMVHAQTEIIIRWKPNGTVLFINDAFCSFFGHEREEIIGQSFFPYTSDENLEQLKKVLKLFSPTYSHHEWEETGFSKEGSPYWIRWKEIASFDENQELVEIQSVGQIITEQKLNEKALIESESSYKALFEQGGDAIYLADMNGQIFDANERASLQLGFSKEEFKQMTLHSLLYRPVSDQQALHFWDSLALNKSVHHDGLHKKKDGSSIPVEITTSKIRLGDKDHILGFVRDVSSKKAAENKQQELSSRYKSILQTTLDGFLLSDLEGNILDVNEAYCQMVGYSKAELMEMQITDLDKNLNPTAVEGLVDSLLTTGGVRFETVHVHKDGKSVDLAVSVSILKREEKVFSINFCRDISNSKHLDGWKNLNASILEKTARGESLESILSAVTKGIDKLIPAAISSIMLLNEKKELVTASASRLPAEWLALIDHRKPGPNIGSCGTAVHLGKRVISEDIDNDPYWAEFREEAAKFGLKACWSEPIIDGERDLTFGTFGVYFKDKRRPSDVEITLIESVANLLSIIIKKVSAEKQLQNYNIQLEKEVSRRTRELKNINEELKSFSYSVSHDLRAPLTRLDGFSKVLQDRYAELLDEKGMHYLSRIRASSQQMAVLIDNMLHLSRIGRKEVKREMIDIGELSQSIIQQLQEAEPDRKIETRIASELTIYADKALTKMMLENLLQNAWKFSQNNENTLIEIGQKQENGSKWFYIKDNGIGFDMKYYDQLFRPFHRLHSSVEIDGHGIGLATVQRIINKHEGLIIAEGRPKQGATFYFKL